MLTSERRTSEQQTYRGAAALDFDYAHRIAARLGIEPGAGVTVAHFDEGWDLDHPAFARRWSQLDVSFMGDYPIARGRNGHGTAVLGLHAGRRSADDHGLPLLPGARFLLVQARDSEERAAISLLDAAIDRLAQTLPAVLLIARDWSSRAPHLPYELKPGVAQLLARASAAGIVVVEAAGNAGVDLDTLVRRDGRQVRDQVTLATDVWLEPGDRLSPAFEIATGAIMVGASTASVPYVPWTAGFPTNPQPRSNVGSRIDCWAPGEALFTATSDWQYTTTFGGTSGASAIIAAAIATLQSLAIAASPNQSPLPVSAIHQILGNFSNGHPVFGREGQIGTVPDLRRIVEHLPGM